MAARKRGDAPLAERVRAFWSERQGMAGAMRGATAAKVLAQTGWSRTVGGCNPYLALRDRAGLSRAAIDAAVGAVEVCELPSARGCTYLVPKEDFAVALRASQGHADDADLATAKKHLGVTDAEIDRLSSRVLDAVAKEARDPAGIKEAVGDAVRALGPEGKKRGVATTLPLALGRLQTHGLVRRVPVDGRLDQQRYRYVKWEGGPMTTAPLSQEAIAIELARRFFRWAGPATVAQLAWWAGLGAKAARAAAAEIGVVPLGDESDRLLFVDDRDALLATEVPRAPRVSFVSSLDNLVHLRREVAPHLGDGDAESDVPGGDPKGRTLGALADLPYHTIVDRGRVVGLWDWDGVKGALAWKPLGRPERAVREAIEAGAAALTSYVKEELGDARSFSLDSPESRVERVEALARGR